jgi:hypothetical protein
MGGIGDFGKSMDDEATRLGISPDELAQKVRYLPAIKSQYSIKTATYYEIAIQADRW